MAVTFCSGNLIVNPGAELGAAATNFNTAVAPEGWTVDGSFTAVTYAAGEYYDLNLDDGNRLQGGKNYFAGGPSAVDTHASQIIDVSGIASDIDGGGVLVRLAGQFGGYLNQDDHMSLTVRFLSASNVELGIMSIGDAMAADRNFESTLVNWSDSQALPTGTRSVEVTLTATHAVGGYGYNDAYADNLSFDLVGLSGGMVHVEGKFDFTSETIGAASGISFDPVMNNRAIFASSQFGNGGIALDGVVQGSYATEKLTIKVGVDESFSGRNLDFEEWSITKDRVVMLGRGGDENLTGTEVSDIIRGAGGRDRLVGGGGTDTLDGAAGVDILLGGRGRDKFVLANRTGDRDIIRDFDSANDQMIVYVSEFGSGLVVREDLGTKFLANDTGEAERPEDRIIYNTTTGRLYFDSDGTGSADPVLTAILSGTPLVEASDFTILA